MFLFTLEYEIRWVAEILMTVDLVIYPNLPEEFDGSAGGVEFDGGDGFRVFGFNVGTGDGFGVVGFNVGAGAGGGAGAGVGVCGRWVPGRWVPGRWVPGRWVPGRGVGVGVGSIVMPARKHILFDYSIN